MASDQVSVTVIGGGIAGITAALKLAKRGYRVTLFERQAVLGGNLGANRDPKSGLWHDVYPHMFSTFYKNFWEIVETDLAWKREEHFQPRERVRIVRQKGEYVTMTDGAPFRNAWDNLWAGILPPADMMVWAYSNLDLMSQRSDRRELLNTITVNSFMGSRGYATEQAAKLHEFILMVIWSAHSYWVPASTYREFLRFSLRDPAPLTWVLRGNLHHRLIEPLRQKLEEHHVDIQCGYEVTEIVVDDGRVGHILVESTPMSLEPATEGRKSANEGPAQNLARTVEVENLVLAVNPQVAGLLAQKGDQGKRLVDYVPSLSETRRAHAEPIAVFDVYFTGKVPNVPKEHVSVWDSRLNLSFLDLSQVWDELEGGPTVLTVAASNSYALPWVPREIFRFLRGESDIQAMLADLRGVLPQIDEVPIDQDKTVFQTLEGHELFINSPGSETWRPEPFYEKLPNLFLAGGYVRNSVGMATVEGAVTSGLLAAQSLHRKVPLGDPVRIIEHEAYPDAMINAMKLALMPAAYWSKWWSTMTDAAHDAGEAKAPTEWGRDLLALWSLPGRFAEDFWKTSAELYASSWDYISGRR